MNLLVTGARGFVGTAFVEVAERAGHTVTTLGRSTSDANARTHISHDLASDDLSRLVSGLRECELDAVVHLAGGKGQPRTAEEFDFYTQINVMGTVRLMSALAEAGLSPCVLIPGSAAQYGSVEDSGSGVPESSAFRPTTFYGGCKIAQELAALSLAEQHGIPLIRTRIFNVTGPGESSGHVCSAVARQVALMERGEIDPPLRVGNLDTWRDFVDVRDVASALELLLQHGEPGAAYNIGTGLSVSIRDVVEQLVDLAQIPIPVETDPGLLQSGDVRGARADVRALKAATGWEPEFTLSDSLSDLVDFWRSRVEQRA